ncbi:hypothetical protein SERLADRAFT_450446 [Serpula lacrymans var. lacrymans S7.9]|uniref:PAS domain-containing protein n=1 Tax=Serpula lacrymans var. lacrymans (strain S7.9) TaxID=578457 RepID=F8P0E4_SERL9|nr:uncharacterized protein SERLADRAFT_450446 [Serpula lacrymans var. lacrymans S7.9]EGO24157.1 hypothetical protein SERLADRAFT_450446 [Serpula lacrymans var. lacrymans S7.9]
MNSTTPFGIVDFSQDARWLFLSESVSDLLGFEPRDLVGRPSLELVHPDEFRRIRKMHYDTIRQDKAAVLAYLRLKHKDPYKGYILCAVSRTVVHNVLVGSVSFAAPGAKAMHNASTAQEVEVVTPSAKDFELRRWGDPSPMPPSPVPEITLPAIITGAPPPKAGGPAKEKEASNKKDPELEVITFSPLPTQSVRTALILDRFTVNCTVIYCSNDQLLSTTHAMGRPFFDFVVQRDEEIVRSWIDVIKAWGVNERGQPSDGGFGFGKFKLFAQGRDSSSRQSEPTPSRHRRGSHARSSSKNRPSRSHASHSGPASSSSRPKPSRSSPTSPTDDERPVDAIFSAHSDGILVILRTTS